MEYIYIINDTICMNKLVETIKQLFLQLRTVLSVLPSPLLCSDALFLWAIMHSYESLDFSVIENMMPWKWLR